ncbi:hypothetical protein BDW22DRAFT_1359978 [Trametopsis cervina]|nr:hypothetical protein BDW22DRAFT_1359978 [Trametopsis cervina]
MGNASSSGRGQQEDTVDFGYLTPQGVYTGPRDWNQAIVTQLIIDRRLAPFYRPLEDYEESWDDEQILAHMKEPQPQETPDADTAGTRADTVSVTSSSSRTHHKRPSASSKDASKESPKQPEVGIYRDAAECPICFLYYPSNINHSRCCDQAICTECFVQIKRADPTTTHLVSEPASCPYCVQENFGVVYTAPPWRAGINSDGYTPPASFDTIKTTAETSNPANAMKKRRKSFGADAPEVVTIDQIRPDWEAKLAAVRATVQRRANRRIVMRQVGDRLIPIGITSGRVHAIPPEEVQQVEQPESSGSVERGSRRARRRQQNQELNQFLGNMGMGGQDLEELMIMEAMRLSLIDHEEQQRKQREEEEKKKRDAGSSAAGPAEANAGSSSSAAPTNAPPSTEAPTSLSPSSSNARTASADPRSSSPPRVSPEMSTAWGRTSMSALEAALRSATTAATAVATPPEQEAAAPVSQPQSPPAPPPPEVSRTRDETPAIPIPIITTPPPSEHTPAHDENAASAEPGRAEPAGLPPPIRSMSFASSVVSEDTQNGGVYDVLPSSPSSSSSSLAQKPLIEATEHPAGLDSAGVSGAHSSVDT